MSDKQWQDYLRIRALQADARGPGGQILPATRPHQPEYERLTAMATAPKQEQIMQLAQAIRQMGMPDPLPEHESYGWDWRPGGRNIAGEKPDPLPEHESYGRQTQEWPQQLQPYGPGKGTAIMGPPPGGYTPMQYVEANTVENERKWQRRNTPGYDSEGNPLNQNVNLRPAGPLTSTTEEQWQQQLQPYRQEELLPYGPQVGGNVSTRPIESQYLNFARQQKGWNPAWNDYLPQLLRKLHNPDVNPTEGYAVSPSLGGHMRGIPQELWSQIAEFAKTIPDMSSREWQGPDKVPDKVPGGTPQNPYAGTQTGQSPSVLSDLARKNAIRRQVLAKLMGRPTGANSLMDLLGQQQPY